MRTFCLVFVAVFSSIANAQHRGPPPEALQACSGQAAGAACAFTHQGKDLTGACRAGPRGEPLACAPAGGRGPPPEALAACASASAGASCSVNLKGESLSGTCEPGPQGEALACRPARQ
jgi:hypothetical protein